MNSWTSAATYESTFASAYIPPHYSLPSSQLIFQSAIDHFPPSAAYAHCGFISTLPFHYLHHLPSPLAILVLLINYYMNHLLHTYSILDPFLYTGSLPNEP